MGFELNRRRIRRRGLWAAGAWMCLAPLASADEPIVKIESDMSESSQDLLRSVLGSVDSPARSVAQARRRAQSAAEAARSVMRSQGFYSAKIESRVIETKAEAREVSEDSEINVRRPPQAVLYVETGPQFVFGEIAMVFTDSPPDVLDELREKMVLDAGEPAEAARVLATELRLINFLQARGYPEAKALPREAVVDHATRTMAVTYNIRTGRKTRFGQIRQTGTAYLRDSFPDMIAPFEAGDVFDIAKMNRLASRVSGTGVFDGAVATLSDEVTENADGTITRDVILEVEQGAINTVAGEIGYSTADGTGVDLTYERRNFIGFAQTLTLRARAKTNEQSLSVNYDIPYAWREDRQLNLSAKVARLDTEAFTGELVQTNALMTQTFSRRFRASLGLGLEASRFEQDGVDVNAYLVEGLGRAVYDTRQNILNPEQGVHIEAAIIPTYNFGEEDGVFATATLGASTYKRVSDKFILAGRVGLGTVLSEDFATVPRNRRFYAGGGGSVRGYEFQSISPREPFTSVNDDGEIEIDQVRIGGRTLTEGSFEVRYKGEGALGYVGFIDAASVSRDTNPQGGETRYGAGVGVRYYTAFAPMRADIAIPLNPRDDDADFQIYISIGQAF